jgi:hypothetical protein
MKTRKPTNGAKQVSERRFARNTVRELLEGWFCFLAADTFPKGSDERRRCMERMNHHYSQFVTMMLLGASIHRAGSLAKFMPVITDAISVMFDKGKLRGAMRGAVIDEAYDCAIWKGKRKDERSGREHILLSELLDEVPTENERTLRRWVEAGGRRLTKKPGLHPNRNSGPRSKHRVSARKQSANLLTAAEKKVIRWHESDGWQHTAIEDVIGKRYKRTDDGDYVTA